MIARRGYGILVGIAAMACAVGAHAESSQGGAFQLRAYGARGWGMGGAFIVLVDDESTVDWNPAGLGNAPRSVGLSYFQLVEGVSAGQSQAVVTLPLANGRHDTTTARHALGAMYTNISADVLGGETYSENHVRVAYALTPEPLVTFAVAANAFISRSGVAGFDAWGTSVDMAGKLSLSDAFSVAVVARDVFSRYTYDDGHDFTKEQQYIVGVAWLGEWISSEVDVVRSYGDWMRLSFGAESAYLFSHVALRGGLEFISGAQTRTAPAFGASVRASRLVLHYGATIDEDDAFGRTHRVSLALGI